MKIKKNVLSVMEGIVFYQKSLMFSSMMAMILALLMSGCTMHNRAPSLPLYGSFFPVWLLAALLGIICSVLARLLLIRAGLHEHLPAPGFVYFCMAILSGVIIWILWTGGLAT